MMKTELVRVENLFAALFRTVCTARHLRDEFDFFWKNSPSEGGSVGMAYYIRHSALLKCFDSLAGLEYGGLGIPMRQARELKGLCCRLPQAIRSKSSMICSLGTKTTLKIYSVCIRIRWPWAFWSMSLRTLRMCCRILWAF